MRLFTAFDLPDPLQTQVAALQAPDALDARWTDPEQFHVTLRFIGDTPLEQAERFEAALSQVDVPPVPATPYGLDTLPSRRDPSVLIVGLERTEGLLTLYERVSAALEAEGLDPEDRTYRPHITLARVRDLDATAVHQFIENQGPIDLDSFPVEAFHLYESTLTSDGAEHERRATVSLTADG